MSFTFQLLVLGGNGFVGTHVCKEAVSRGLTVASLNRYCIQELGTSLYCIWVRVIGGCICFHLELVTYNSCIRTHAAVYSGIPVLKHLTTQFLEICQDIHSQNI